VTVSVDFSGLKRTRWYEYATRFLFGGAITALAGIIAKEYGPTVGGLFLAFPAIFPASATLVETHVKKKQREAGGSGTVRGRQAAALDALGASLGALGLMLFGLLFWKLILKLSTPGSLACATAAWLCLATLAWKIRKAL
jgi:hypothetical protein